MKDKNDNELCTLIPDILHEPAGSLGIYWTENFLIDTRLILWQYNRIPMDSITKKTVDMKNQDRSDTKLLIIRTFRELDKTSFLCKIILKIALSSYWHEEPFGLFCCRILKFVQSSKNQSDHSNMDNSNIFLLCK